MSMRRLKFESLETRKLLSVAPTPLTELPDSAYFSALVNDRLVIFEREQDASRPTRVWVTDGTPEGTSEREPLPAFKGRLARTLLVSSEAFPSPLPFTTLFSLQVESGDDTLVFHNGDDWIEVYQTEEINPRRVEVVKVDEEFWFEIEVPPFSYPQPVVALAANGEVRPLEDVSEYWWRLDAVRTDDALFVMEVRSRPFAELKMVDDSGGITTLVDFSADWRGSSTAPTVGPLGSNKVVFMGYHARGFDGSNPQNAGQGLWVSDGTEEGTRVIRNSGDYSKSFSPDGFAPFGDRTLFSAFDSTYGRELWVTDGTPEGTLRLTDANPDGDSLRLRELSRPSVIYTDDTTAYVFHEPLASNGLSYLTKTDGTPASTSTILMPADLTIDWRFSRQGFHATVVDGRLFFTASHPDTGTEIWMSDGTLEGTQVYYEFRPGPKGQIANFLGQLDESLIYWTPGSGQTDVIVLPLRQEGDIDGDGDADFEDFLVLSRNFGESDRTRRDGDLNDDKQVDFADFLILSGEFGKSIF